MAERTTDKVQKFWYSNWLLLQLLRKKDTEWEEIAQEFDRQHGHKVRFYEGEGGE